jgi:hypothetical protein
MPARGYNAETSWKTFAALVNISALGMNKFRDESKQIFRLLNKYCSVFVKAFGLVTTHISAAIMVHKCSPLLDEWPGQVPIATDPIERPLRRFR